MKPVEQPSMSVASPVAVASRIGLAVALVALLGAACWLYAVRGEAILLDLAGMARGVWCF